MTRPLTWICLFLALGSGLFLYQAKHRSQMLDREITQVMKAADAVRARTAVLQAEYQLLSDPQRLGDLTASHLTLRPTAPGQFSTWTDLARRLPPIGLPTRTEPPADLEVATTEDLPLPPIPPETPPVAIAQPAPTPAPTPKPTLAPIALAARAAPLPLRPAAAPIRTAALPTPVVTPMVSSVLASAARPYGSSYGAPSYGASNSQAVGSSLGMARSYQLPSALGTANAATFSYGGNQ